uniref:Uncharacterized protein n=1 Tax=Meloidogyne incognita TaxID=6306 RepID=A0A914KZB3_MELIC
MPDVKKALHIPPILNNKWEVCSSNHFNKYTPIYEEMANFIKTILNANIRVIFYNGDLDMRCNMLMGQRFTEQLGYKCLINSYLVRRNFQSRV